MSSFPSPLAPSAQPLILGIETSCDETAAAVVSADRKILSNVVLSQWAAHAPYGGVVPEIAARAHIDGVQPVVEEALRQAGVTLQDITAIAATGGPGLIGGVMVGVMAGKALSSALGKPFIAVNHLEGHALTVRLTDATPFPYLLLLASGGHCQFILVHALGKYETLGGTLDDALGEAYDKTAKLLGLGMPGGPAVEAAAREGDAQAHDLTQPLKHREGCDLSFSGLKTSLRLRAESLQPLTPQHINDLCASFQRVAVAHVCERAGNAFTLARTHLPELNRFVLAGGVAANTYLREKLKQLAMQHGFELIVPPPALCTDNAAMIAWAGMEHFLAGRTTPLDFEPRPRWPLSELA